MNRCGLAVAAAVLAVAPLAAQALDQRVAHVGVRSSIEQLVLPGSELVASPLDRKKPIVLRVLATWPHGSMFRYDLEWSGLEPGKYDLREYLVRKDGSSAEGLPPIAVAVQTLLPPGQVEPNELEPVPPPALGGYRTLQIVAGALWLLGLLAILFVGRRRRRAAAIAAAHVPTFADRLRPLVEAAASGGLNEAGKAELERLLLAYWRERLQLFDCTAVQAIGKLRLHKEAGELLRHLEAWLHMPAPPAEVDVSALLAPYRGSAVAIATGGAA